MSDAGHARDSIGKWDEIGGLQGGDAEPGWNVRPVLAATEGVVPRLKIATFGRPITTDQLNRLAPKENS